NGTHFEAAPANKFGGSDVGGRDADDAVDGQRVRGPRFGLGNRYLLEVPQQFEVQPGRVDQEAAVGQRRAGRFQVQTVANGDGKYAEAVAADDQLECVHACAVRSRGKADQESTAHAKHVAAFDRRGQLNAVQRAVFPQLRLDPA